PMKKTGIILLFIALLGIGNLYYMTHSQYYYVKITTDGKLDTDYSGKIYSYKLKGYNKNGKEKELEFSTHPDLKRPFKKNAYLKIKYTNWKKVNGYEEMKKSEIPKKALNKLE
ncbi:YxeA family protein, partial [Enterococcus faecium]